MSEIPDLPRIIIVYCGKLDIIAVIFQSKPAVSISDIGIEVVTDVLCGCGGTVYPVIDVLRGMNKKGNITYVGSITRGPVPPFNLTSAAEVTLGQSKLIPIFPYDDCRVRISIESNIIPN